MRAIRDGKVTVCVPDAQIIYYRNQSPSYQKEKYPGELLTMYREKHYPGGDLNQTCIRNLSVLDSEMNKQDGDIDFGEVSASLLFVIQDMKGLNNFFFEIGVNSLVVSFAQAELKNSPFIIPLAMWKNQLPDHTLAE